MPFTETVKLHKKSSDIHSWDVTLTQIQENVLDQWKEELP